jgi:multidrug efflux pump subunit AcrA (membrane-fusion protein)
MVTVEVFKKLKPWRLAAVAAVLAAAVTALFGAGAISGWSRPADAGVPGPAVQAQEPAEAREVAVRGRLAFPQRAVLSFDTAGKVGEILVEEGDRVVPGQPLARLDNLTVSALQVAVAQAEFDRDAAQQALARAQKADFTGAPLQRAEHEAAVAEARKEMEDAQRRLRDFQRNYQQDLAGAMQAVADAEADLEAAQTALGHFERDQSQDLANARKALADAESALDRAVKDLAEFDETYQLALAAARSEQASALDDLRFAEDVLSEFYVSLGITRRFSGFDDDVPHRSLEEMRRLQANVVAGRTRLEQAQRDLAHLEGNRSLLLQERQTAVEATRAGLSTARDEVAELEAGIRPSLEHQRRRAAVESAQARLAQAEMDLQREREGPDQAELVVRERAEALARESLNDLEGPDPYDVAVKDAGVLAAEAGVEDARKNLEGATVRAPFAGIVSLVNVKVDDVIHDKSRVLEVIDPTRVEVDGLIDAIDVRLVQVGSPARVSIATLPDRELAGTVVRLAPEPRTERGVVSYPIRIQVDLPEGVEVPVRLSPVNVTIIPSGAQG